MLFWIGAVSDQALVVNVRGFGLVLISGCGRPPIEWILGITERVLDVPIRAVIGGLHLPVHVAGTALIALGGARQPPTAPWRWSAAPAGTASKDENPVGPPAPEPERLLSERFARGEVDEDEYHQRLTSLRAASPAAAR